MSNIVVALMALQSASPSPACANLASEFAKNERTFALSHQADQVMLEAAEAVYGGIRAAQARTTMNENDERFKAQGDRIVTLLVANRCQVPDHVTSASTYASPVRP